MTMDPKLLAIIDDDDFWLRTADTLLQKRREDGADRAVFAASSTFERMLAAFTHANTPVSVDSDELAYVPEQVIERVWAGQATVSDVQRFLDVMSHPLVDEVPRSSRVSDPECPFFNERYPYKGVIVSMMSGQGTVVGVCNPAALLALKGHP